MIKATILFEPVEDKPGYYWFNKRNYQIISKEVLEKAINELRTSKENKNKEIEELKKKMGIN